MSSRGGLDMDVRPAEVAGREATFNIALLNQSPAPAVVALAARDSEDGLLFHIEPQDPVIVPAGAAVVLAAMHVSPKARERVGRSQSYEIEVRGLRVGEEQMGSPDLVARARFTYVPRQARFRLPAGLRPLPVSTVALMLVLLLVLLLQVYLATQPGAAPPAVPTPVLPGPATQPGAVPSVVPTPALPRVVTRRPAPTVRMSTPGPSIAAPPPGPTVAAAPPALMLIPDTLAFDPQDVNTTSAPQTVHLVNLGPTALTIASVTVAGPNPREFNALNACAGATIDAYGACTLQIRFRPILAGPRRAMLVIADNAVDTPQTVPLRGVGRTTLS